MNGEDGSSKRNPRWTRDELVLALDLYIRRRSSPPGPTDNEVIELSHMLGRLHPASRGEESGTLRNANGVAMKLMNFRRLDPDYTGSGKVGLTRGNKDEAVVWDEFANEPARLREAAANIRANLTAPGWAPLPADDEDEYEAEEGRVLTRVHRRRERDKKVVAKRKEQALKTHGKLCCEVCQFDFEAVYGERGRGFIECHHLQPVHTLKPGEKTRLEDLALLCANCHRMIHAKKPWPRPVELLASGPMRQRATKG